MKRILRTGSDDVSAEIAAGRQAVWSRSPRNLRHDGATRSASSAQGRRRPKRQALQEIDEGAFSLRGHGHGSPCVVGVDVGDDRDHRRQEEEGGIRLVGLGDQESPAAEQALCRRRSAGRR